LGESYTFSSSKTAKLFFSFALATPSTSIKEHTPSPPQTRSLIRSSLDIIR
jgi:hypothetical protein